MRIEKITDEAPGVRTFRLNFVDDADREHFTFSAGQFGEYSVFGEGESTFCIASSPTRKEYIECTFRQTGRVTSALARKEEGDIIGFRGPSRQYFSVGRVEGEKFIVCCRGYCASTDAERHLEHARSPRLVQRYHCCVWRSLRCRPGL